MPDLKEMATCLFVILMPSAWILSSVVSFIKERNRHAEMSSAIEYMILDRNKNFEFAVSAIQSLARQKSLIVVRDDDGLLRVMALDTAGKEELQREFARQDAEKQ